MNKTIKQLADELGVSKTAVRNYMDDDFRAKYTETDHKGVITISADGCKLLSENIGKSNENSAKEFSKTELITIPKSVFDMMEKQIEELQGELKVEREHSRKLSDDISRLADQSQQLHLRTEQKHLLEAPKKNKWQFWKKDEVEYERENN